MKKAFSRRLCKLGTTNFLLGEVSSSKVKVQTDSLTSVYGLQRQTDRNSHYIQVYLLWFPRTSP